ncbi:alpha/beta fold hydrolase [Sphingopyxis sp. 22461]|jgi:pimeloyl-ACP methyl ester carboxylesterase|uniref:alpha/beta fold hydrolase n=1 Tax=Sphingopyxis sp. 22461 TaxID=3453923 RepID=UPI003F858B0E
MMEPYILQDFGGRFLTGEPAHAEGKIWPGISGYVEWFVPAASRPVSVLFVHGGGGQGSEFLRTPDGRPGWAHSFLRAGFPVYILDRPGHGRCAWNERVHGPALPLPDYGFLYPRFVEPERHDLWPEAAKHDRWPDDPRAGDRFMASQGPMATTLAASQHHVEAIADALFELIGPTIIVSHSAGGPCGWALAAKGDDKVEAIVAIEPLGYPGMVHPLGTFENGLCAAPYAGTADPFDRPVAIVTGEATWMREANARAAAFVRDRGNVFEHIRLEEHGIGGNGHMLMSEINSAAIADLLVAWIERSLGGQASFPSSDAILG